jgi:hypothetical protein
MLKELYSQYGEIMVQMEVLQARLNQVKSSIFAELKPKQAEQTETTLAPPEQSGCCPETNGVCGGPPAVEN